MADKKTQHNHDEKSDGDILRAMADGRYDAFTVFSDRYLQPLNRLVYRLGFHGAEAEDMLQEILVKIWQKAHKWQKHDGISARAWIYRVATNLVIDMQRKNKRSPSNQAIDVDVMPIQSDNRSDKQAEDAERAQHIKAAMQKIPERPRMALVLVYYQEMSNKEAAAVMGVSVKAIEGLLVRARKMMRQNLVKQKQHL